jgi:tRNA(adenine34) deaminase
MKVMNIKWLALIKGNNIKERCDFMIEDIEWMKVAIQEGEKAAAIMEVPIGAVIVYEDRIIGAAYNQRNTKKSTLAHAEILAIEAASEVMGDWRLEGCTMYVTVEPCPMCAGAIVQARMDRVVIGTMNQKAGCAGSVYNLLEEARFNHQVQLTLGVLEKECSAMMSDFFRVLREMKKVAKDLKMEENE